MVRLVDKVIDSATGTRKRKAWRDPRIEQVINEVAALFPEAVQLRVLNRSYYKYIHLLENLLPLLPPGGKVLDVGAGPGPLAMMFARLGFEVHAVDTWAEYPEEGDNISGSRQQILQTMHENGVKTSFCNVVREELPFSGETFDAVLFIDVIEHLHTSPMRVMLEMRRVLKQGGLLAVQTPNVATLKNRIKFMIGRSPAGEFKEWFTERSFENIDGFFGHVREFTVGELRAMFEMSDFEISRVALTDRMMKPTPVGRDAVGLRYSREFKIDSPKRAMLAAYMLANSLLPETQYVQLIIGRKTGKRAKADRIGMGKLLGGVHAE